MSGVAEQQSHQTKESVCVCVCFIVVFYCGVLFGFIGGSILSVNAVIPLSACMFLVQIKISDLPTLHVAARGVALSYCNHCTVAYCSVL